MGAWSRSPRREPPEPETRRLQERTPEALLTMLSLGGSLLGGRISPSLLGRHLPDDQGALFDLLANVVKLLLALLLRTLLECHRRHLDQRYRPAAKIPNAPRGDWYTVPRVLWDRRWRSSQGQVDWTLTARGPLSPASTS